MARRIYRVKVEVFENGGWVSNYIQQDVSVIGGADQAIKVATPRVAKQLDKGTRFRAQEVALLAEED